jgi:hypothetical protein
MFGFFGSGDGKNRKEQLAQLSDFLTEYAKVKKFPVRGVQEDDSFTLLFATFVIFLQISRGNLRIYTFMDSMNPVSDILQRALEAGKNGYSATVSTILLLLDRERVSCIAAMLSRDLFLSCNYSYSLGQGTFGQCSNRGHQLELLSLTKGALTPQLTASSSR